MDWLTQAAAGFQGVAAEPALKEKALVSLRQWLRGPEFAAYRPQIEWLCQTAQWAGLLDRFYQILPFGTGGRRGPVGVGPNRMNFWTLGASVQGHCEYLKERFPGVTPLRVVLAYDVRRFEDRRRSYNPGLPNPVLHVSSRDFAQHAAGVYTANGIQVHLLPENSPRFLATPELSYAVRLLGAHGGLNMSASHNPPDDNGAKFYDERGGQPVPPDDQIMADLVEQVSQVKHQAWPEALRSGRILPLEDSTHHAYIDLCRRQSLIAPPQLDEIKLVFTPLHGVGSMTALEVLTAQGFRPIPVPEQMTPDGQFPNVTQSPNPEVPASMDRAERLANSVHADLVLATDPDADRLGGMFPVRGQSPAADGMMFLDGNELAAMLTHFKLSKLAAQGRMPPSPIVMKSLVTTNLVTRIARHFGAQVVDNLLVGFKYIAEVLWQLEQNGTYEDVRGTLDDFVIAVEESHGILVMPQIRDKDAGGAALLLAELALDQKRRGSTVADYQLALERQFGYFRNRAVNIAMTGVEGKLLMARMLDRLRSSPPAEIGGMHVTDFEDLRHEQGFLGPIKGATDHAARNFLIFHLGDQARIALRPSGTEPKAKAYVEVASDPCPGGKAGEQWPRTCREVGAIARRLADEFSALALGLVGLPAPPTSER
jgi:phosphoglucomutase/phosphomannomutase